MSVLVCLPEWPLKPIRALAAARGVPIWPVGGVVRDALLGGAIHDWDFVVGQDALGLARAVADGLGGAFYPLDVERDTGRVVLALEDGRRLELDFALLRGPDLATDLRGRDFTLNAMAADADGRLLDPTGGLADLQNRLVRATDAAAFEDDPLRMLRGVRLVAELGLRLEAKTALWIAQRAPALTRVAAERIRDEFLRILAAPAVADHIHMLDELGLLTSILPEAMHLKEQAQSPPHRFDVWWHTLMVIEAVEGVVAVLSGGHPRTVYTDAPQSVWADVAKALGRFGAALADHLGTRAGVPLLRLAALCHDLGKPLTCTEDEWGQLHFYGHERVGARIVGERLQQLRFSRAETEWVEGIVRAHLRPAHLAWAQERLTRRAVYRFFRDVGAGGIEVTLLALADHLATWGPKLEPDRWGRLLEVAETLVSHYFEQREEAIAPRLLVTGKDLIAELGMQPGPEIGRLLEALREAQAAGDVRTREEALALARRLVA